MVYYVTIENIVATVNRGLPMSIVKITNINSHKGVACKKKKRKEMFCRDDIFHSKKWSITSGKNKGKSKYDFDNKITRVEIPGFHISKENLGLVS